MMAGLLSTVGTDTHVRRRLPLVFFLLLGLAWNMVWASESVPSVAAVASAHPLATQAGREILQRGGNAFDAAVAVAAALAVVEPSGSGLGGGGFFLLHDSRNNRDVMIDARETAPQKSRRDMYLDDSGNVVERASLDGALAAGIPGLPAGLTHIAEKYGSLSLDVVLAPAIRYARDGFPVDERYRLLAGWRKPALLQSPAAAAIFLLDNDVPELGASIKQADLADTLDSLRAGNRGFYQGPVAERLVKGVQEAGGIWTLSDLADYRVIERDPVRATYHDIELISAPPPSSGGVALATMLNILEGFDLRALDETTRVHLVIESMRRAYRDRAVYLGDPDFVDVPVTTLTDKNYAAGLRAAIRTDRATRSEALPGAPLEQTGADTTHFSVIDTQGNRVAATLSINLPFGAAFVAPGTGVLLNDEMDDFAIKPGTPNAYGLIGDDANAIEPGKRPLSSMSPTFLVTPEKVAIVGTPGGSRIITMVLLATLGFAEGQGPEQWVSRPRFHHQFLPDAVQYEPGAFNTEIRDGLSARGHQFKEVGRQYGNMQAILWDRERGEVSAASDPRGVGNAERVAPNPP